MRLGSTSLLSDEDQSSPVHLYLGYRLRHRVDLKGNQERLLPFPFHSLHSPVPSANRTSRASRTVSKQSPAR